MRIYSDVSRFIRIYPECIWIFLDVYRYIRIYPKCIWIYPDISISGYIWIYLDICGIPRLGGRFRTWPLLGIGVAESKEVTQIAYE
jgi:hypothetical protein